MTLSSYLHGLIWRDADHSISAHAWEHRRTRRWGLAVALIDAATYAGHCRDSWLWHEERAKEAQP